MGRKVPEAGVEDQLQQRNRTLKATLIGMSAVLALCAIAITATIIYRFITPPPPTKPAPFGVSALPLPAGCAIDYVLAEGDRMILQVGGAEGCRRILVTDLRTGDLLGQFQFPPE